MHHALNKKRVPKTARKARVLIHEPELCLLLCNICNTTHADTDRKRDQYFEYLADYYGKDAVEGKFDAVNDAMYTNVGYELPWRR